MKIEIDSSHYPELVERIRSGDESAFQQVVRFWQDRVYNYALRYSNDQFFAKEVVQKTFIQLYEKIDQLKDPSKLQSWLYRIASNHCYSEGRSRSRRSVVNINKIAQPPAGDTPARKYERQEMKSVVKETLLMIPGEQRQVIIMKEFEGMKFREIAETLQISENTVKSRMYYGLDAMRKILLNKNYSKELYNE